MGKIYRDLGILATDEVLEKSASDMIGQFVGHTGDKTKKLLESALGKVLLIDEAYRLAKGDFAKEAADELVDLLTKPQFARKLIVILAGYDDDIERLMATNPGLTSRFPERIPFQEISAEACVTLLMSRLGSETYLDVTSLHSLQTSSLVIAEFERLIRAGNWANARDVQTLASSISRDMLQAGDVSSTEVLKVTEEHIVTALRSMADERERRAKLLVTEVEHPHQLENSLEHNLPTPRRTTTAMIPRSTCQEKSLWLARDDDDDNDEHTVERDEGVSDEVWSALLVDKQRAVNEEKLYNQTISSHSQQEQMQQHGQEHESEDNQGEDNPQPHAAHMRREQERLRLEHLRRQKEDLEARQEYEKKMQQKLRVMGVCSQGFRWIKQSAGYRCAGGSHFVANASLESMP